MHRWHADCLTKTVPKINVKKTSNSLDKLRDIVDIYKVGGNEPSDHQGRPTMAKLHSARARSYEAHEEKVDRFESALLPGGLIHTAKEAVALLSVIAHSNHSDLAYISQYLAAGITNRLQESLNTSPAVEPTQD